MKAPQAWFALLGLYETIAIIYPECTERGVKIETFFFRQRLLNMLEST